MQIKPYVPGKPVEEVERELGITDVIKLASNENPLGPAPSAVSTLQKQAASVSLYPDGNCYYLKEALSQHLGVSPAHLIVGNGSDEIIELIAKAFLNEGKKPLWPTQLFSNMILPPKLWAAHHCGAY